jgi:hypothetical protein
MSRLAVYCLALALSVFLPDHSSGQECPLPLDDHQVVVESQLSDKQLRDFRQLTGQKVSEFQRYLTVVADPGQQDNIRELAIENALMLFLPDATMQVGSNKITREYPLAIYLRRLKNLDKKYFDIAITFYDLALLGDWTETDRGYLTTATYFQRFQAFNRKGQPVYEAKTAKQMAVDLRNRKDPFYEEHRWTVLLGNVRLAETAPRKAIP